MVASLTIRLNKDDDVVIARQQLVSGTVLADERVTVQGLIPPGHKVSTRAIPVGQAVRRYGQVIGFASKAIEPGQHIHVHNLAMGDFARDYAFCADTKPTQTVARPATFQGIVRKDGRVATRNYIGILTSVNCSATVARGIADHFRKDALAEYPNVDGVVALTINGGCCIDGKGEGMKVLRRTLAGYAQHANFAGVLIVGLGCETNQIAALCDEHQLNESTTLRTFNIQNVGGTAQAVAEGIGIVKDMLPSANRVNRQAVPASHLTVALQCSASKKTWISTAERFWTAWTMCRRPVNACSS